MRSELLALPRRYPLPLPLRYRTTPKHGTLHGFGQARMISSQDIIFAAANGLKPGMEAEIALAWPFLLEERTHLQLVLEATITDSEDGVTEARIMTYDFRTRRPPLVPDIERVGLQYWAEFLVSSVARFRRHKSQCLGVREISAEHVDDRRST